MVSPSFFFLPLVTCLSNVQTCCIWINRCEYCPIHTWGLILYPIYLLMQGRLYFWLPPCFSFSPPSILPTGLVIGGVFGMIFCPFCIFVMKFVNQYTAPSSIRSKYKSDEQVFHFYRVRFLLVFVFCSIILVGNTILFQFLQEIPISSPNFLLQCLYLCTNFNLVLDFSKNLMFDISCILYNEYIHHFSIWYHNLSYTCV